MNWIHSLNQEALGIDIYIGSLDGGRQRTAACARLNWEGKGSTYHGACVGIHTRANPMYETNTSCDHINAMH
jgi:hypothetical protein